MFEGKKRCSRCKKIKLVCEFHKDKSTKSGHDSCCKICRKNYQQSPKGKESHSRAQNRHNATDKRRKSNQRFKHSLRGLQVIRKAGNIRRTNETQFGGTYSISQWYRLCEFYGFRCLRCNKKFSFNKLTLDHVKPVSKGGSSFIMNLQPLCKICNSKKGNKEIDYRQALPDWINRDEPVWIQDSLF